MLHRWHPEGGGGAFDQPDATGHINPGATPRLFAQRPAQALPDPPGSETPGSVMNGHGKPPQVASPKEDRPVNSRFASPEPGLSHRQIPCAHGLAQLQGRFGFANPAQSAVRGG